MDFENAVADAGELRLDIGYFEPPDLRETADLFSGLIGAFDEQNELTNQPAARLVIESIEISSLIARLKAVLELAGAGIVAVEHRDLIQPFVENLGLCIQMLRDASGGYIPPRMTSFLGALVTPLEQKRAKYVRVSTPRHNGAVIEIEAADDQLIYAILDRVLGPTDQDLIDRPPDDMLSQEGEQEIPTRKTRRRGRRGGRRSANSGGDTSASGGIRAEAFGDPGNLTVHIEDMQLPVEWDRETIVSPPTAFGRYELRGRVIFDGRTVECFFASGYKLLP